MCRRGGCGGVGPMVVAQIFFWFISIPVKANILQSWDKLKKLGQIEKKTKKMYKVIVAVVDE
jgi:hypothetical protein